MWLCCASFNVLADAYLGYGSYEHVDSELLVPGARLPHLLGLIDRLEADVIGLQEVEKPLREVLEATGVWQPFWTQKDGAPDGCLTLVRQGITVEDPVSYVYSDGSGHVMQSVVIGDVTLVNTHIKWAPAGDRHHSGIAQTDELLEWLGTKPRAVILADCNDRPGGPVRARVEAAGFRNVCGDEPTALIGQERAALDLIAVRGIRAERIPTALPAGRIPSNYCPSDHIPVMAWIKTD